jgi:hypothetical protein
MRLDWPGARVLGAGDAWRIGRHTSKYAALACRLEPARAVSGGVPRVRPSRPTAQRAVCALAAAERAGRHAVRCGGHRAEPPSGLPARRDISLWCGYWLTERPLWTSAVRNMVASGPWLAVALCHEHRQPAAAADSGSHDREHKSNPLLTLLCVSVCACFSCCVELGATHAVRRSLDS